MRTRLRLVAAIACVASVTASAGDIFVRKPGLWKITMQMPGSPEPHLVEQCLAADTDARVAQLAGETMKGLCSKFETHKVGATFVSESTCKVGNRLSHGQTVTTVTGDTSYHVVVKTHYDDPPAYLKADSVVTQDGRWAGPCPATMNPGDQIMQVGPQMPGGMKTNLLETLSR